MSIALGPLGRNGEASSSVNTNGNLAAMYLSATIWEGLESNVHFAGTLIPRRKACLVVSA